MQAVGFDGKFEGQREQIDTFCVLAAGIRRNAKGDALKEQIVAEGIVAAAIEYLQMHQPPGIAVSLA